MQQLMTLNRPRWRRFLEELVIDEYVEGMMKTWIEEKDRPGAPVIACPDRVFDTTTDRLGRNQGAQNWGEIEFADANLKSIAFLVYQDAITDEDAVDLYEDTLDTSRPADEVFHISHALFHDTGQGQIPLRLDGLTTEEFLTLLDEGEVLMSQQDELYSWNEAEDMEHMAELLDDLYEIVDEFRLHYIDISPKTDDAVGIMTEYLTTRDLPEQIDEYLWTDDDYARSYTPHLEETLIVRRRYGYRGGGFSCTN